MAIFCLLAGLHSAKAQNTFGAGLIAGVNACQINGDESASYNKLGLRGGIEGQIYFGPKADLSIGMLFSQRGSLEGASPTVPVRNVIHLNYIEVPVLFTYRDWLDEFDDFYKVSASAGLSYGRLINYRIENFGNVGDILTEAENFSDNDVSLVAGISYYLGPHFGFTLLYSRSIIPLYNNRKHLGLKYTLTGYFLSFQTKYTF
ncbi:MAG: PorT family protein [Bacteroidetes bacterium]|nr:PorT family protein [Bacteroidota bacterium]